MLGIIFLLGCFFGVIVQFYHFPGKVLQVLNTHVEEQVEEQQTSSPRPITLRVRKFVWSENPDIYDTEMDSTYAYQEQSLDMTRTALVLIDVWESHENDGWLERAKMHCASKIVPLVQLAHETGLKIIHAPHRREIAHNVDVWENDLHLDRAGIRGTDAFDRFLKKHNIDTLIYAGYVSNMCVLHRPIGMIRMRLKGYRTMLLRDCTIAFELPETLDSEFANLVTINMVENYWGGSTTLSDLELALNNPPTDVAKRNDME